MPEPAELFYRFGPVEFDVRRGAITRDGVEVHVKPKTFQVATYLITHAGELVSKDDLILACWPEAPASDDVLAHAIADLRHALGDDPRDPKFVKTIPRRGYRFIGEVTPVVETVLPEPLDEPLPPSDVASALVERGHIVERGRDFARGWATAAGLAVLAAVGGMWWYLHPGMPAPAGGKRQVAVFRFENRSGQGELEWLRDGIPDMIATSLSRSVALDLLSREQLSAWLGRIGEGGLRGAMELAKRSRSRYAILGSVAKLGASIRVEAQVYDGRSGVKLAAESMVAERPELLLSHIDSLASKLAASLVAKLPKETSGGEPALPANFEAFRYYSLGLEQVEELHTEQAVSLFQQALALDPEFDMAYARIGFAYAVADGKIEQGRPYLWKAVQHASRLTAKDRLHVLAWYAIATQNYAEAIGQYRTLLAAYPREMESYHRLAQLLRGESRHEESAAVLREGLAIDVEDPYLWNSLSAVQSEMGNHAEAVLAAKRFMELKPGEANAYDTLALALDFSGASDRALEALEQALRLNPTFGIARVHRQAMLARGGRLREAIEDTTRPDVLVSEGVSVQRYRSQAAYALWKVGREHESRALIGTIDPALNAWGPYLLLDVKAAAAMRRSAIAGRSGRWGLRQQFYYLAEEARVQNQPERRLTHLREALRYRPSWGGMETLEDALGDAYLDAGRWDEAISEYQRALSRFPGTPLTRYHLAQARARKRENVAAARQYRLFLQAWASADEDLLQIAEARQGAGAAGRSNADVRSTAAVRRAAGPKREVPGPVNPLLTEPHFWSESTVPRLMN